MPCVIINITTFNSVALFWHIPYMLKHTVSHVSVQVQCFVLYVIRYDLTVIMLLKEMTAGCETATVSNTFVLAVHVF